jgi:soluble lytic murein transglycosylase
VAALIAQESTFDADIRSSANAWGLMQVVPATGRRLARSLGIRKFSIGTLTHAETNIRLGTLYFSQLVKQFGGTYYALASYNAGESRVRRWKAERPDLDEPEFIDDIPYPETQNYVKRILGTAEDYRRLYSGAGGTPRAVPAASTRPAAVQPAPKKAAPAKKPAKKKAAPKKVPAKKKAKG